MQEISLYDVNSEPQISPDGKQIAYSYFTSAQIFTSKGEFIQELFPSMNTLFLEVRFIDNERLALFYRNPAGEFVEFWDLQTGEKTYIAPYINSTCEFSSNGHTMVCKEKSMRFIDTVTGEWLMDIKTASNETSFYYTISPDDLYVAYCSMGSPSIFLFRRKGGSYKGILSANSEEVCGSLSFSPDSQKLASGAGWVWDVTTMTTSYNFISENTTSPLVFNTMGDIFLVGGDVF